jgi:hypothetical protein
VGGPASFAALRIGDPADAYEREADRIADRVVSGAAQGAVHSTPPQIQRHAGASAGASDSVPSSVDGVLAGSGRPLDPALRGDMEGRFGHDFSQVRVHSDAAAAQSARDVNATAYTVGSSIVFGAGRYTPDTQPGRRLLAHELTHVVQQSGAAPGVIQREVERRPAENATAKGTGVSSPSEVLDAIAAVGAKHVDTAKKYGTAFANLQRLIELGFKRFNPGAPGKGGPTNAFVYTCHCGWIDMGHFFSNAIAAFAAGYLQQVEVRVEGEQRTANDLLSIALEKGTPGLDPVLATVPGKQSQALLGRVRALLRSGDPRDTALALGFGVEFFQQAVKLAADRFEVPPNALKGEQRSAFTIEDLSSDCYGAVLGEQMWNRVRTAPRDQDLSPVHELMSSFLADCGAVDASGRTLCEMMNETTPGSCTRRGDREIWAEGTPVQDLNMEAPNLLASAKPLCPSASPKTCKAGIGPSATPLPKAILDVSAKRKSLRLILPDGVPGVAKSGATFVQADARGRIHVYSSVRDLKGLGDSKLGASANLRTGRFDAFAKGRLTLHAQGKVTVDFERLLRGAVGPELAQLQTILKSSAFIDLVAKALGGGISHAAFVAQVRAMLRGSFPGGVSGSFDAMLQRLTDKEALAAAVRFDASGSARLGDIPITGFILHKSGGLNPVLAFEGGVLTSDLAKGKLILGGKGWLYGERILQAQAMAGVDVGARAAILQIHAENQALLDRKLSFDLRYAHTLSGDDAITAKLGFEF